MQYSEPVYETFGPDTGLTAIVMAPMMAAWDYGKFCASLIEQLIAHNYCITVYDTMSLARSCHDIEHAAATWGEVLRKRHHTIDLAVGQAYGGAVLHYLLGSVLSECPGFLGISAPVHCDDKLRSSLQDILQKLYENNPAAALQKLEWYVLADDHSKEPPWPEYVPDETTVRLSAGLSHLCKADSRVEISAYNGRALWIYGENSRLVRGVHIPPTGCMKHNSVGLSACGMRPLSEAKTKTTALIEMFLNEKDSYTSR